VLVVGKPVPDQLAAAAVFDASGRAQRLDATWRDRDIVLVCVRHFACIGCAEQVTALRPRLGELAVLNVDVVIVGSGTPEHLARFVEREDLARPNVHGFTDPSLEVYRAAGFVRSVWGTFGPTALVQAARAWLHGHRNGRPQGDLYQQGGALYVTRAGTLAFYHRATTLGDHVRLGDVVDVALAQRVLEEVGT
jgi:peroxiredoxin